MQRNQQKTSPIYVSRPLHCTLHQTVANNTSSVRQLRVYNNLFAGLINLSMIYDKCVPIVISGILHCDTHGSIRTKPLSHLWLHC